MKIIKRQLRRIIKEELGRVINEQEGVVSTDTASQTAAQSFVKGTLDQLDSETGGGTTDLQESQMPESWLRILGSCLEEKD